MSLLHCLPASERRWTAPAKFLTERCSPAITRRIIKKINGSCRRSIFWKKARASRKAATWTRTPRSSKRPCAISGSKWKGERFLTGPSVTQYTFRPAVGVKISKILSLQNDLSLALAAHPIRIEAPIPGKSLIGIEVPNKVFCYGAPPGNFRQPGFQEKDIQSHSKRWGKMSAVIHLW